MIGDVNLGGCRLKGFPLQFLSSRITGYKMFSCLSLDYILKVVQTRSDFADLKTMRPRSCMKQLRVLYYYYNTLAS